MAYTHTHTHTHNSVSSASFVDSICSVPCHPPFAPHPLWQVEGIQTHDLRTLSHTHTQSSQRPKSHWHMVSISPTHTHICTPAVGQCYSALWCQAGWAARCMFTPAALGPNTGWGIRADSTHRRTATRIQWTDVYKTIQEVNKVKLFHSPHTHKIPKLPIN